MRSPAEPSEPVRAEMPDELGGMVREDNYKGRRVLIPDIGPYAPTTSYHKKTYEAFASPEGQRFMRRYYETGWLRRDSASGEWVIRPPPGTVPRRR
ncbi:hypothetical protein GF318_00200 [Candidatus Micrarchaeota archaeon]|nr:hypothetical protein [Candidatus Micrarchaeota archaeon]